jgi:hypothetical protein
MCPERTAVPRPLSGRPDFGLDLILETGMAGAGAVPAIRPGAQEPARTRMQPVPPRRRTTARGAVPQPEGIRVSAIPGSESTAFQPT